MTTLEDLRVLDLSDSIAGAYATKLFAGYGADVIAIEPPSGNPLRQTGVWDELGANKRSVTLDIETATGRRLFRKMVEQANVVVETYSPGRVDALRLAFADLYGIKRRIILVSIAPEAGSEAAQRHAGLNAFAAAAIAAHNADAYEVPQHVQISVAECVSAAIALGGGLDPGDPPFQMSEVAWVDDGTPGLGEHTAEFLAEDIGVSPAGLLRLRAAGVI